MVEKALLDSSVMENFLDHRTTKWLGIPTWPLEQPIWLTNMDGTTNQAGQIEWYCDMIIQSGRKRHMTRFYKTSLGGDQIIFGYPWLRTFNLEIDWEKGMVATPRIKAWIKTQSITIATAEEIPEEYARHIGIFDEEKAKHFPPKQEEDHAIKLKDNVPAVLDCKIYQLLPDQDQKLDEFLNEHLQKGYIWESNSPYTSPFFFIKKKDRKLQPVQDYRKLNKQTIHDTYPLPLIKTILEQLEGKSLFTKFDIRWGYHSQTFNPAEQNYNVYDWEFLAIIRGLENWRHLLVGSPHLIVVLMDHNNLQYYQHSQRINRQIARYLLQMADYNIKLNVTTATLDLKS